MYRSLFFMLILFILSACDAGHGPVQGIVKSALDDMPIHDVRVSAYDESVLSGPLGEFRIDSDYGSGEFNPFAIFENEDNNVTFYKEGYKKKRLHIKKDMEVYLEPIILLPGK